MWSVGWITCTSLNIQSAAPVACAPRIDLICRSRQEEHDSLWYLCGFKTVLSTFHSGNVCLSLKRWLPHSEAKKWSELHTRGALEKGFGFCWLWDLSLGTREARCGWGWCFKIGAEWKLQHVKACAKISFSSPMELILVICYTRGRVKTKLNTCRIWGWSIETVFGQIASWSSWLFGFADLCKMPGLPFGQTRLVCWSNLEASKRQETSSKGTQPVACRTTRCLDYQKDVLDLKDRIQKAAMPISQL